MKRVIIFVLAALFTVSCLDDGRYETSYTAVGNFEYTGEDYTKLFTAPDSVYFATAFPMGNGSATCLAKLSGTTFLGGCAICIGKDSVINASYLPSKYKVLSLKGGNDASKTYMVYYDNPVSASMPEHTIKSLISTSGVCTLQYCYVNNTNDVVNSVLYGRGSQPAFKKGDYLKLTVTGFVSGTATKTAEIMLAEYNEKGQKVITEWTKFDLGSIGVFDALDFDISSNVSGVPAYVCVDDIVYNVHITQE